MVGTLGGLVGPGEPYMTRDGSQIEELVHPNRGGPPNLSVARAVIEPGQATHCHYHAESDEVYYVLSGKGVAMVGGKWEVVEAGVCVSVPARAEHRVRCDGDGPLVILCLSVPPYTHEQTVLVERTEPEPVP
jgi:mannose-6-phosphate isomerase-like protein (cupin superfamily)